MTGRHPKLVAAYAFRYDAQLVPDMRRNLEGFVDEFVEWDDRSNEARWYQEGKTRRALIDQAKAKGADWIIGIDPDERFEASAGRIVREAIRCKRKVIFSFNYRELYTPDSFRVDGIWRLKRRPTLFPVYPDQQFHDYNVHSPWHPVNGDYRHEHLDVNLYHLKMIDPQNRAARKDLYNALDPMKEIQEIGYDYLDDEAGMLLERIPRGRDYFPSYDPDYGIAQFGDNKAAQGS